MTEIHVDAPDYQVSVDVPEYVLKFGLPGIQGPPGPVGPTGIVVVKHDDDPSMARPDAPMVLWAGSVVPTNADQDADLIIWTA
jgi:hypothetical protein